MATVALLQEALVNSLMLNGPLGTTLGLDADDGDEESGGDGDDDDGSDGEALDTTLVRRGAELSGIARSAYSPLKELEEELPNLEEEELPNSVAPPVGETKTMTQRLHERILSGGPPLPNMDERILSAGTEAAAKAKAEAAEAEAARVEALETARAALARSEQLEAEVPMPASNGL